MMIEISAKQMIYSLIEGADLDSKLDVLTSLGLATENTEIFRVTEEIRSELCDKENPEDGKETGVSIIPERGIDRDILSEACDGENSPAIVEK